jgi:hypothetical protein
MEMIGLGARSPIILPVPWSTGKILNDGFLSNRQQQHILAILNLLLFSTALIADSPMMNSINDNFLGCHTVKAHLPINADDSVTLDNLFWGSCPGLS